MIHRRGPEIVDLLDNDKVIQANFGENVVGWVESAVNTLESARRNRLPQSREKGL